jgi:RimJ/RimL family protein N-acetyltransferase
VRAETRVRVDAFWSRYFDVPVDRLHQHGVIVSSTDDEWPGIVVAGDECSTWIRCPEELRSALIGVAGLAPSTLWRAGTWRKLLGRRVAEVFGPSIHAYADDEADLPADDPRVREVVGTDLAVLARQASPGEWAEGGFAGGVLRAFGLFDASRMVAAANLTDFDGMPADVGVLTDPRWRGRGLGFTVAAAATGAAIAAHGVARWRALHTNRASRRIAERLGFTPYGSNLTVRLLAERLGQSVDAVQAASKIRLGRPEARCQSLD